MKIEWLFDDWKVTGNSTEDFITIHMRAKKIEGERANEYALETMNLLTLAEDAKELGSKLTEARKVGARSVRINDLLNYLSLWE